MWPIICFIVVYNYKLFFCECFMILPLFLEKLSVISFVVPLLLWKCVCIKFSTKADILSYKMIMA